MSKRILSCLFGLCLGAISILAQTPLPAVHFSQEGGYHEADFMLTLTADIPEATIFYTLNGSKPTSRATRYTQPIPINKTTVVRAIALTGNLQSKTYTHTYFLNEPATQFVTVSISIAPQVLFDPVKGLFQKGIQPTEGWKQYGANFWSRREAVPNVEIFDSTGACVYNNLSGLRVFGGMSRLFPQKSMAIIARERYGKKFIKHRLFGEDGLKRFKFLVLRNAGSDWGRSQMRDAFMTGLLSDWQLEMQDKRPCHVYINGQYWGLYDLAEKINKRFLADHCDVDKDSIDLLEHRMEVKAGSDVHYKQLLSYLEKNDLRDPAAYAHVQTLMDVDNFMDYQLAQIYFDNRDAGGNIRYWRPQRPQARWRWILYDTDFGFGLNSRSAFKNNTLAFMTAANGPAWPNPPWSTFILRKLLQQPAFAKAFVVRCMDLLNTTFAPQRVEALLDSYSNRLRPEIGRQHQRWRISPKTWERDLQTMRAFAQQRPFYLYQHLQEKFGAGAIVPFQIDSCQGGHVWLNQRIKVAAQPFIGNYFDNIPVTVQARPQAGYRFVRWEGVAASQALQPNLTLDLRTCQKVKAHFTKTVSPLADKIMINEIACGNKLTGDWVELYNNSRTDLNLAGWQLSNGTHTMTLPAYHLPKGGYAVLATDTAQFRKVFPTVALAGVLAMRLSKKQEMLLLYAAEGAMIDSLSYTLLPTSANFTMGLTHPDTDNSALQHWEIRAGNGTPAAMNAALVAANLAQAQLWWSQAGGLGGILLIAAVYWAWRRHRRLGKII